MTKSIEISLPSDRTDALIRELQQLDGLIGLKHQREISLKPPGDVIAMEVTSAAAHDVLRLLTDRGLRSDPSTTVKMTTPVGMVAAPMNDAITHDENEATPEEIELSLTQEGSMAWNGVGVMVAAGVVATVAIATNAIHVLIGAMVIAPGFEPISRLSLGLVSRSRGAARGALDFVRGYGALVLGAGVTAAVLDAVGTDPRGDGASYHLGSLLSYFTQISAPGITTSIAAATAGAILIAVHRSVLTAGVMIALALIPSITLVGIGVAIADWDLAGRGLVRWLIEVVIVATMSIIVFGWKAKRQGRRQAAL